MQVVACQSRIVTDMSVCQERARERKLHVHEKTTYMSRMNTRMSSLRRAVVTPDSSDSSDLASMDKTTRLQDDTQFILATTRG